MLTASKVGSEGRNAANVVATHTVGVVVALVLPEIAPAAASSVAIVAVVVLAFGQDVHIVTAVRVVGDGGSETQ